MRKILCKCYVTPTVIAFSRTDGRAGYVAWGHRGHGTSGEATASPECFDAMTAAEPRLTIADGGQRG